MSDRATVVEALWALERAALDEGATFKLHVDLGCIELTIKHTTPASTSLDSRTNRCAAALMEAAWQAYKSPRAHV